MSRVYLGNSEIHNKFMGAGSISQIRLPGTPPEAFIEATEITSSLVEYAITELYNNLVAANLWDKFYTIYPFVGATQLSNSYNLKLTGAYQISFGGGWTYNNNGIQSNGTGVANTDFLPGNLADWGTNSHMSVYRLQSGSLTGYDIGGNNPGDGGKQINLIAKFNNGISYLSNWPSQISGTISGGNDGKGLFVGVASGSVSKLYKQGTAFASGSATTLGAPVKELYIGGTNGLTGLEAPNNSLYAWASLGQKLSDSETSQLTTIVELFQNTLGRGPSPITTTTTTTAAPTTTTTTTTTTSTTTTTTNILDIDYLIAGAGGEGFSGGGGGGQFVTGSANLARGSYAVIAAKITTGTTAQTQVSGSSSFFASEESKGGGNGGYHVGPGPKIGWNGASGGGGGLGNFAGGTGSLGFNGSPSTDLAYGGGGGGASITGSSGPSGKGGDGKQWLDGNYYCGGGKGEATSGSGLGASTSGGGGGNNLIGPSGPGTVIIRYLGDPRATGGTQTQSGGYTYHTYTGSLSSNTTGSFVW